MRANLVLQLVELLDAIHYGLLPRANRGVFAADPEDYTARGRIITPLKDRIGAEIRTHYPDVLEVGMDITRQEAWLERESIPVKVPDFVAAAGSVSRFWPARTSGWAPARGARTLTAWTRTRP